MRRREFVAGSLTAPMVAGFALAVAPSRELLAQTITTDSDGLLAGAVTIAAAGLQMPAYRAQPAGKSGLPTVLVVSEIFGVHEYIQDVCRRFAKAGYLAIAPNLFARQGDPTTYQSAPEIISNVIAKVPDTQVMADLDACAAWAGANHGDAARLAITGFCWGGRIVWMYSAHHKNLKAAVAWYGRLSTSVNANTPKHPHDIAEQLHAPVLGLYGGKDEGIPLVNVEEMVTRLSFGSNASQASSIHVYPDAPHAFHADYRPSFRPAAAQDGWQRCIAWLRRHGV